MYPSSGFGFGPNLLDFILPVFVIVIFTIVIGAFIFIIIAGVKQYLKNEASPILTVDAKIVTKRVDVRHSSSTNDNMHTTSSSSTSYYITFQVESNDRIEFSISSKEYGLLAENDIGKLTFQGTRFLGFQRI